MSNKVQELLGKIKQLFDAAEKPEKFMDYKLADGTILTCDKLEVGGLAKIGDTPAAAGEYKLEDGTVVMVGENGAITAVTAPAAPAEEDLTTPEGMRKAYDKFANGTMDQAGMNTVLKALMEYCFGWQLKEAETKATAEAAMKVYKETLGSTQAMVKQQGEILNQMFALVQEVVGLPVGDPPPNPKKKFSFSNVEAKNKSLEKYQAAAATLKKEWDDLKKVS